MKGEWAPVAYSYDGTFAGFLSCVFESYVRHEEPMVFTPPEELRVSLYPERSVATDEDHARRVYASLAGRISPRARALVAAGFLTCLPEKERALYRFIRLGYERGGRVMADLTNPLVAPLVQAITHLKGEAHLYRGFVRFSDQGGVLVAQIQPKNRVLPVLRVHFCTRYAGERFLIWDKTHREALVYQPGHRAIVPLEELRLDAPGDTERTYRALWKRFYDTIAIEGRYNPRCRMTHMPKRYWSELTEFQEEPEPRPALGGEGGAPLPPSGGN